jgi:hypothetical protein
VPPSSACVCELVPAFVIPSAGAVESTEVEHFEECVVREYIDTRIVACSLENLRWPWQSRYVKLTTGMGLHHHLIQTVPHFMRPEQNLITK